MIKLFNMDLHISVIEDIKYILKDLYGDKIEITKWSLSSQCHIFGEEKKHPEIINSHVWSTHHITEEMLIEFSEKYSSFLKTFDGFIVTHTPIFCLLYEKFNKPIILINSCRYEQPYCWNNNMNMWNKLNVRLLNMYEKGILKVVSNNKADNTYIEMGTTIPSVHIPSLCLYTNEEYFPIRKYFMLNNNQNLTKFNFNYSDKTNNITKRDNYNHSYKWSDFYSHKGMIHFPYEISTMSIFEHYSANIPLFFPSKKFLKELIKEKGYNIQSRYNVMYGNNPYHSTLRKALHNDYWVDFWVDQADFYDEENMKYITYFDDMDDMYQKINSIKKEELYSISDKMKEHNKKRKEMVYEEWKKIFTFYFNL